MTQHTLRSLASQPAFTLVAVAVLALGIGANTAIFSVLDGVLLRPAPVAHFDRLVVLWETDRHSGTTREPSAVPDFQDFEARSRTLDRLGALIAGEVNLTPPSGDPVRLAALDVSSDLLPMLGIEPIVGRTFTADDEHKGGPEIAIISASLWQRVFGRDPNAIGRTLRLDDRPCTVVGVVPDATDFGVLQILSAAAYARAFADRGERARVEVWRPLRPDPDSLPRDTHPAIVVGRLAPGVTAADAQTEMTSVAADLERAYRSNDGRGVHVEALSDVVFGPVRPALLVLVGAVALVLLVACVNVANLLLARGASRAHEIAVRRALGASGGRLLRQFVVECTWLSLAAGAAGVGLAYGGLRVLVALAPADVPRLAAVGLDLRVLAATLAVSVVAGFAFGLVPALQAARLDVQSSLRDDGTTRGTAGRGRARLRRGLVVAELALATVLAAGAVLLVRSFEALEAVDPGFRTAGVLKAEYQLPATRYPADFRSWPDFKEQHAFTRALLARARSLPGVESAAIAGNHPLDPGFTNSFSIAGREAEARTWPEISVRRVTPGYFRTVGLALVRGRLLRDADATTAAPVALLNEAAVARFFPNQAPIGARIQFWGAARTIVGIVADERFHGLAAAPPIAVYVPLAQAPSANGAGVLLVRAAGDPLTLASAVRRAIHEQDPSLAVFGLEPLAATMSRSVSERRLTMLLLGLFAGLALLLAAVGTYGVLSGGVAERRREIGIRLALGARPAGMVRAVAGEGLKLAAIGLAAGAAGALALTRLLSSLLFGVTPTDPATFAAVAIVLLVVAMASTAVPAWRASRVDPVKALRSE